MSFMPSPGSLVRFKGGMFGLVVSVTPEGTGDMVVPLGYGYPAAWPTYEIAEIVHEAEDSNQESRPE